MGKNAGGLLQFREVFSACTVHKLQGGVCPFDRCEGNGRMGRHHPAICFGKLIFNERRKKFFLA
jgi:hypothetical protein